jgi:hypothetical protein
MRRLVTLVTAMLLSVAPLGGLTVLAQDSDKDWDWSWEGVTGPETPQNESAAFDQLNALGGATGTLFSDLKVYEVGFTNPDDNRSAYIPEIIGAEFMAVIVDSGEFVLDVKGPGSFLIEPAPDAGGEDNIEIMKPQIPPDGLSISYEATGHYILDEKGNICTTRCTVLPGFAVRVSADDGIIAPAGAICVWCLLHQNDADGVSEGTLLVFPLLRNGAEFSWVTYHEGSASAAQATPTVDRSGADMGDESLTVMAWAFNPGAGCRRAPGG